MGKVFMDKNVCSRLGEEIDRLNLKQMQVSSLLGVTTKTVSRWLKEIPIPSDKLGRMSELGVDVVYVLTGKRQGTAGKVEVEWFSFGSHVAGYDHQTSTVLAPAYLSGVSESEIKLITKYDNTPSAVHEGMLYVPASWLAQEFSDCRGACMELIAAVEAHIAAHEATGLSQDERAILDNYRALNKEDKTSVHRLTDALAQSMSRSSYAAGEEDKVS